MVEVGKEMSSDKLISTSDYSDCGILEEEKDYICKNDFVWVKSKKINMERKSTVNFLK